MVKKSQCHGKNQNILIYYYYSWSMHSKKRTKIGKFINKLEINKTRSSYLAIKLVKKNVKKGEKDT